MKNHRDYVREALDKFMIDKKPGKVLEIGSGPIEQSFKSYFEEKGWTWLGQDSASFIGVSYLSKMEDLNNILTDSYDLVFSCHSFEHCERPVDALREFNRVLKPEGNLFMATPNPCKHHILDADADHIFVLHPMQMVRLVYYCGFDDGTSSFQKEGIELEQNYNVITIANKRKI